MRKLPLSVYTAPLLIAGCFPIVGREPSLIQPMPDGAFHTAFWIALAMMGLSIVIRTVRCRAAGQDVGGPLVTLLVGLAVTFALMFTVLGSVGYWFLHWVLGLGLFAGIALGVCSFLGGLAPGFYASAPLWMYVAFHDVTQLYYVAFPALVGDLIEAVVFPPKMVSESTKKTA